MAPLIGVNVIVSLVRLSSRKRSLGGEGKCGRQIVLKPVPFHVPTSWSSGLGGGFGGVGVTGGTGGYVAPGATAALDRKAKSGSVSIVGATVRASSWCRVYGGARPS